MGNLRKVRGSSSFSWLVVALITQAWACSDPPSSSPVPGEQGGSGSSGGPAGGAAGGQTPGGSAGTTNGGSNGGASTAGGSAGASSAGSNGGTAGGAGAAGGNAGAAGAATPCTPSVDLPERLVRLDYNKLVTSLKALLGANALDGQTLPGDAGNSRQREFQPLMMEGDLINVDVLTDTVNMTEGALKGVTSAAALATFAGCIAPVTDACIEGFLGTFAEKAYRRPLAEDEKTRLIALYRAIVTSGMTREEAARHALEGALLAPQALYRSELGSVSGTTAKLTPYEVASALSYFLTDGPPDTALYATARDGTLATDATLRAQLERILASPQAIENLNQVMAAYFSLSEVDAAIKDKTLFPEWNSAVTNSLYTETNTFIRNTLWQGKLSTLVTSNTSYVNSVLATLYGIPYPGANGGDPASTFVAVQFPAGQRAGILTQGSVVAMRARTNDTSVVSRGLYVNSRVLCLNTPPPPPATVLSDVEAQLNDSTRTQRQKADARAANPVCTGCHRIFDPYGLSLETFDAIGRYRTSYPGNVPIDTSTTLPMEVGGRAVKNVAELAAAVAENGTFTRCVTSNFMKYARSEAQSTLTSNSCAVEQVHTAFLAGDQGFSGLIREVALALSVSPRTVGGP